MKVLISVGGRFHAIELASELEKRGHLERLITTKSWYGRGKVPANRIKAILAPELIGSAVRRIPPLRRRGYYSWFKDNLFDALARKYLIPCDIFHAWGNYALSCIPIARALGAKVVIERGSTHPRFQDEILKEEFARYHVEIERAHPQIIEKGLREIELADRVAIPSEFVRRSFLERGVPESKLALIPYGIDLAAFKKAPRSDAVFRLLFVGNIGIQKGVHYLLDVWKQLALRDAELVLIGRIEGGMEQVLKKYEGWFTYRGHVPHEELYREYSNVSVFVLPSLQEGSALVTYEAMACGLPCIVSENTGSIVRDGIDGIVIPIRSAERLKEAILRLRDQPEEAERMGRSGAEHVRGFTWSAYAGKVIALYESLTGDSRP